MYCGMIISLDRFGSKESNDDSYTTVLHGYCLFDDEMSVISVVWRDCYQLIDHYNDEQVRTNLLALTHAITDIIFIS